MTPKPKPPTAAAQMAQKYAVIVSVFGVVMGAAGMLAQMIFLAAGGRGDPSLIGVAGGVMTVSISGLIGLAIAIGRASDD